MPRCQLLPLLKQEAGEDIGCPGPKCPVPAGSERRAAAEPLNGSMTNIGWWHEVSGDSFLRCSFELLRPPLGKPPLKLRPRLPKGSPSGAGETCVLGTGTWPGDTNRAAQSLSPAGCTLLWKQSVGPAPRLEPPCTRALSKREAWYLQLSGQLDLSKRVQVLSMHLLIGMGPFQLWWTGGNWRKRPLGNLGPRAACSGPRAEERADTRANRTLGLRGINPALRKLNYYSGEKC